MSHEQSGPGDESWGEPLRQAPTSDIPAEYFALPDDFPAVAEEAGLAAFESESAPGPRKSVEHEFDQLKRRLARRPPLSARWRRAALFGAVGAPVVLVIVLVAVRLLPVADGPALAAPPSPAATAAVPSLEPLRPAFEFPATVSPPAALLPPAMLPGPAALLRPAPVTPGGAVIASTSRPTVAGLAMHGASPGTSAPAAATAPRLARATVAPAPPHTLAAPTAPPKESTPGITTSGSDVTDAARAMGGRADADARLSVDETVALVRATSRVPEVLDGGVYSASDGDVRPPVGLRRRYWDEPPPDVPRGDLMRAEILVSASGEVESVKLLGGERTYLDGMILSAVKGWKFQPAMREGLPVRYRKHIWVTLSR